MDEVCPLCKTPARKISDPLIEGQKESLFVCMNKKCQIVEFTLVVNDIDG